MADTGPLHEYVHVARAPVAEEFEGFVPLQISPYECVTQFLEWRRALWLTPRDFAEGASELRDLKVVYAPFYCFTLAVHTAWKGTVLVRARPSPSPAAPLYCTALYSTILYYTVLHGTALPMGGMG
jgi:hypothetical protein